MKQTPANATPAIAKVFRDGDKRWTVRIVRVGDRWGLNGCFVLNPRDKHLIEFYDPDYDFCTDHGVVLGQFVTRYLVQTLIDRPVRGELNLHGGVPKWRVSATTMYEIHRWLESWGYKPEVVGVFDQSMIDERITASASAFRQEWEKS